MLLIGCKLQCYRIILMQLGYYKHGEEILKKNYLQAWIGSIL
ncbi:unknown [Bacteroides sp. CAG:598]|nr:unknown [Bacteroides sp. CAG:598]